MKKDEKLLTQARKRFKAVMDAEAEQRSLRMDDLRFYAGDSDNGYQWPDQIRNQRQTDPSGARPCLTINKLPQHVRQVVNEQRMNRPAIRIIPVDGGADQEVAEMLEGMVRHIESISGADTAYATAAESQVISGVGYFRILTDYVDDDTDTQEILIKRIRNPFTVYLDPEAQEPDGSDMRYAFVTEVMSRASFEAEYPDVDAASWSEVGEGDNTGWVLEDTVRVAEYWHRETKTVDGKRSTRVMWCKIGGDTVLDEREWPGRYIPICRVVGDEIDVDGRIIYKGIIRNAKDAQRMYNYWSSTEVEMIALAPKAPFIGALGVFDGLEDKWQSANVKNYAYLEYNPRDAEGNPAAPPQRQGFTGSPAGVINAKLAASDDMKSTTGQYDASLGSRSNETSGRAIIARQREGDVGTYHYIDNLGKAIRYAGKIIIDLIPKIYDVPRIARILGEDGMTEQAAINPSLNQAVMKTQGMEGIEMLYNPSIGRYDVVVSVGPSYTTKRQEAADMMMQMAQSVPQLVQQAGDIIVRSFDLPGAKELSDRLKMFLPPEITQKQDEGQNQQAMMMQQQVEQVMQQAQMQLQQAGQQLAEKDQQIAALNDGNEVKRAELSIKSAEVALKANEIEAKLKEAELRSRTELLKAQIANAPKRDESQDAELRDLRDDVMTLARQVGMLIGAADAQSDATGTPPVTICIEGEHEKIEGQDRPV